MRGIETKMITMTRTSLSQKTRRRAKEDGPTPQPMDRLLFLLMLMLIGVGIVTVYDASYALAIEKGDSFHFVKRQAVCAVVGLAALLVTRHVRYWRWRGWANVALALAAFLLVAVYVPHVGTKVNGAHRWILHGSFQPSELAKLALVLYLARLLSTRPKRLLNFQEGLLSPLVVIGFLAALIAKEPDMGTALVFGGTGLTLLFLAGARPRHMAGIGVVVAALLAVDVALKSWRMHRIAAFLNPKADQLHAGYQVWHGLMGLGSGGITGRGLGEGVEKLYIPMASSDFIFPVIGEEWGLIGTLILVVAFALIALRGFTIAYQTRDPFGALLAAGITTLISIQALVNMAVATALIPDTGVPPAVHLVGRLGAGADDGGRRPAAQHLHLPRRPRRGGWRLRGKARPVRGGLEPPLGARQPRGAWAVTEREIRILVTGGGTGGHVTPALAVIQTLQEMARDADAGWRPRFRYVGSAQGVEAKLAREAGVEFIGVQTGKLRRTKSPIGLLRNLADMGRVPVGVLQSLGAVRRFRPHVVLATGGYVSVPPVVAAGLLGIPVLIHEQTVQVGLANRIAARFARRIALTFEGALADLPPPLRAKAFVTGNPVRAAVFGGDKGRAVARFGFSPGRRGPADGLRHRRGAGGAHDQPGRRKHPAGPARRVPPHPPVRGAGRGAFSESRAGAAAGVAAALLGDGVCRRGDRRRVRAGRSGRRAQRGGDGDGGGGAGQAGAVCPAGAHRRRRADAQRPPLRRRRGRRPPARRRTRRPAPAGGDLRSAGRPGAAGADGRGGPNTGPAPGGAGPGRSPS